MKIKRSPADTPSSQHAVRLFSLLIAGVLPSNPNRDLKADHRFSKPSAALQQQVSLAGHDAQARAAQLAAGVLVTEPGHAFAPPLRLTVEGPYTPQESAIYF
jgi:hypothetical protein